MGRSRFPREMALHASFFSGAYGARGRTADLVITRLTEPHSPTPPTGINLTPSMVQPGIPRNVIGNIDKSGSMREEMPLVRATLLALGQMLGIGSAESSVERGVNFHINAFSDTATALWSPGQGDFETAVNSLHADGSTNISATLDLSFSQIRQTPANVTSWIFLMTDGEANAGAAVTTGALADKVKAFLEVRPNTLIICIGFGTNYRPEMLNAMGTFTHVRDAETLNATLTLCLLEVLQTEIISGKITLPALPVDPNNISPNVDPIELINHPTFPVLSYGSEYLYVAAFPPGTASGLIGQTVHLEHLDLMSQRHTIDAVIDGPLAVLPIEVVLKYFQAAKSRMLTQLAKAAPNRPSLPPVIADIRQRLANWEVDPEELARYGVPASEASEMRTRIESIKGDVEACIALFERVSAPTPVSLGHVLSTAADATGARFLSPGALQATASVSGQTRGTNAAFAAVGLVRQVTGNYMASPSVGVPPPATLGPLLPPPIPSPLPLPGTPPPLFLPSLGRTDSTF